MNKLKKYLSVIFSISGFIGTVILLSSFENTEAVRDYKSIAFSNIQITGELYERTMRNFDRLEEEKYRPDKVFLTNEESNYWPGDTEGRTMLGLVLDAQATKREPKYLKEIIDLFPQKMNRKGYFGNVYSDSSVISEQQLSSHGWVLRGLSEYYLWKKDPNTLNLIDTILANLVFPTIGHHTNYPLDPKDRIHSGGHSGSEGQRYKEWLLSTDTGCDFILLDGLTQAYQIRPSEKLKAVIEEMIGRFLEIKQVDIKAQTHATLTALRALLRYYETSEKKYLLDEVEKRYAVYKNEGMTENYENYNWFGRPQWTEPCAVVDSYITAVMLWKHTGNASYLEDAHHIYYNGLSMEQRANGGFGIQSCSGAKNPMVEVSLQEAHWCCTMRGGEGLSRSAEYLIFTDGNSIAFPFYQNAVATIPFGDEVIKIQETTGYPYTGKSELKIVESNLSFSPVFRFYVPVWMSNPQITLNGKPVKFTMNRGFAEFKFIPKKNDLLILNSKLAIRTMTTFNKNSKPGYFTFRYGPHILGYSGSSEISLNQSSQLSEVSKGVFKIKDKDFKLTTIYHLMDPEVKKEPGFKRQILFR